MLKVRRALLSVSDKSGIVELARALIACGVELLSTGGTARLLQKEGIPVTHSFKTLAEQNLAELAPTHGFAAHYLVDGKVPEVGAFTWLRPGIGGGPGAIRRAVKARRR